MRCSHCGECCKETEMMLSKTDIRRLERMGYHTQKFVRSDKQGHAKLRNSQGYCIFYDAKRKRCLVYSHRPTGCRVYPVIYSVEEGIVVDDLCPMMNTISRVELQGKGKVVVSLLRRIDREAKDTCFLHEADKQS